LPNQLDSERGIEIEFPEHVTGMNNKNGQIEHLYHLYLESIGSINNRVLAPVWTIKDNTLIYETILKDNMKMVAHAKLDSMGIKFSYEFINQSDNSYQHLQAITCVQLYSLFADTLLERTYIHTDNGFELMASETKHHICYPSLERWVVVELFEQFHVVGHDAQNNLLKYAVAFHTGVLTV